jgi:hypothetical protein
MTTAIGHGQLPKIWITERMKWGNRHWSDDEDYSETDDLTFKVIEEEEAAALLLPAQPAPPIQPPEETQTPSEETPLQERNSYCSLTVELSGCQIRMILFTMETI